MAYFTHAPPRRPRIVPLLLAPKRVYKLVINCFIIFVYFSEGEGRRNGVFHSMPNISMQNPPRRWLCLPTNPWWETSKIFLTIGIYTLSILRICLCLSIRLSINPSVRNRSIRSASIYLHICNAHNEQLVCFRPCPTVRDVMLYPRFARDFGALWTANHEWIRWIIRSAVSDQIFA